MKTSALCCLAAALVCCLLSTGLRAADAKPVRQAPGRPNIVLIVADNLGYGDVGCFGSKINRTPALDRMAAEGMRLTSFCVASSVCTPSRAAFMTGCYPVRVNMDMSGTRRGVLQPVAQKGLAPGEVTIAEVLKEAGYTSMCIGKWHLGDQAPFLPTRQGFDGWLGVPYSEDMIPTTGPRLGEMWPPVPLVRDEQVIEAPVDPNTLTARYTEEAVSFIRKFANSNAGLSVEASAKADGATARAASRFFLYLPHAVPGSSKEAFASEAFRARSRSGVYGACVEELDWSAGEILRVLQEEGLDSNTLVVWTSDNGAFHGRREEPFGQNLPLRGTGGTIFEGGFRVPCIARWPGKIPAGTTSNALMTSMDLLPTLARLAGGKVPRDRKIDGRDIWPLLSGREGAASPHDVFYYYKLAQLRAVRSGRWKLHLPVNTNAYRPDIRPRFEKLQLYDLEADVRESANLAGQHPEIVARLTALAEAGREELGDTGIPGSGQRPAGWVDNVTALRSPGLPAKRWFPGDAIPMIAPGAGMSGWTKESASGWGTTSSAALDADDAGRLAVSEVTGDAVLHNTAKDAAGKTGAPLTSIREDGDLELHLEFLLAQKSNSGVYLMGRYEVQLFDSHGKADSALKHGDCGGIYQRWDEQRDPKGYEGAAPSTNASRPAGEWQSLDVVFRAPRFGTGGNKTEDARFVRVALNGVVIHENVPCSGPTRGSRFAGEAAAGPLVLQGDHGPVAFRNGWVRERPDRGGEK